MAHGHRRGRGTDELAARLHELMAVPGPLAGVDDETDDELDDEVLLDAGDEELADDWPDDAQRTPGPVVRGGEPAEPSPVQRLRGLAQDHVAVIAVVCAVALVFAITQVLRARATTVEAPAPSVQAGSPGGPGESPAASGAASGAASAAPSPESPAAQLRVHVIGAVHSPGVVTVPADARVSDALEAAGGLSPDADPGELNLAQSVCDGCQIVIGTVGAPRGELNQPGTAPGAPAGPGAAGTGGSAGAGGTGSTGAGELIDLNTATSSQLEELPGIGPVLAERIVEWRGQHGRFARVEELQEVSGIGEKLYSRIKDHVRV